jgi:hypothetical protein
MLYGDVSAIPLSLGPSRNLTGQLSANDHRGATTCATDLAKATSIASKSSRLLIRLATTAHAVLKSNCIGDLALHGRRRSSEEQKLTIRELTDQEASLA